MKLNVNEWKEFQIGRLFNCTLSTGDLKIDDCEPGSIPLISSGETNNGLVGYIDEKGDGKAKIFLRGKITVDMFCNAFYQDKDFYSVSHGRVNILDPLFDWNNANLLFITTIINKEQFKYSYGRAVYNAEISRMIIKLPVCVDQAGEPLIDQTYQYSDQGYIPDFQWMEAYIKSLNHQPITTKNTGGGNHPLQLDVNSWQEFSLDRLFTLIGGFYNKKPEHSTDGTIPFLASTENNNGVTEYYSLEDIKSWDKVGDTDNSLDKKLYTGNCIAVTVNGSVCNAFYQARNFTCSHDITALYLNKHELTPSLALFLCTMIMKDKYRWSYGRKPHDVQKFGKSIIKLPVQRDDSGVPIIDPTYTYSDEGHVPDWEFMENYIKALPYGDRVS